MTTASCVTPPTAPPYAGVLAECGRILRKHANASLTRLNQTLTVDVDTLWRQTYDAIESDTLGELLRALLRAGDTLPHAFAESLERAMQARLGGTREDPRSVRAQHFAEAVLSLVDDTVYSESLLIGNQARLMHNACENELRELMPRLAALLGIEGEVTDARNPLSPEVVATALKDACWTLDCGQEARRTLLTLLGGRLAGELPAAYRAMLAHLTERRVLPRVRHAARRDGRTAAPSGPRTPESAGLLRRIVGPDAPGTPPRAANDAVMDALTRLQRGQTDIDLGGLHFHVEPSADGTANIVRALLDAGLGRQVGQLDGMVIDLVATLFDFIFDDERVPPLMKALIGRLQLPVLKQALADHHFFSDRRHPARRLLNTLAQAASTWDGELTPDSTLYLIAEPLVARIQDGGEDIAAFEAGLAAVEAFLAEQERLTDARAESLADQLTAREIDEIAHGVAADTVAPHLADETLPAVLRDLLAGPWTTLLAEAAREGGETGDAWVEAVETMDELIWSVRPKTDADERQRLVHRLPGLIRRLRAGLERAGLPEAERATFFAELVQLHAAAVKNGMQPGAGGTAALPPRPPAPAGDFLPPDDGLDELERGDWVELRTEGNRRSIVRLTWISPARTMFLFANRQGVRAVALTRSELARRFERGEAWLIDDEPLVDRLVTRILDTPRAEDTPT